MNTVKLKLESKKDILSIYFTAGYPGLNDTETIIQELENSGADLIEVGLPFSDPIADGTTIQESSSKALKNGINLDIIFEQLKSIKNKTKIPLIVMGYLNQMLAYGEERFLKDCMEANIQALIIPDLPIAEYQKSYKHLFEKYNLSNIFLISPQTSPERIREIDDLTDTFIYMVSSSSITGAKGKINDTQIAYFERIKAMKLINPTLIGFGISNRETFSDACKYSNGAIIGSAFINKISEKGDLKTNIHDFVKSIIQ